MRTGRALAGGVLAALLVLALALPAAAATLEVSPGGGLPGSAVTVTGSGFAPSIEVRLCWDGPGCADLGAAVADGDGSFTIGSHIPSGANAGPHEVWACQEDGDTGVDCAVQAVASALVDAAPTTTTTTTATTTTVPPSTTTAPPPSTTTSNVPPPPNPSTTAVPPPTATTSAPGTNSTVPAPPTSAPPASSPAAPSTSAPTTTTVGVASPSTVTTTAAPHLAGAGDLDLFSGPSPVAAPEPVTGSAASEGWETLDLVLLGIVGAAGIAAIGYLVWIRLSR